MTSQISDGPSYCSTQLPGAEPSFYSRPPPFARLDWKRSFFPGRRLSLLGFLVLLFVGFTIRAPSGRYSSTYEKKVPHDGRYLPSAPDDEHYLLSAPFYIYPEILCTENASLSDGRTAGLPNAKITNLLEMARLDSPKHSDDILFLLAALKHPMRVMDPKDAKLFVVPTMLNVINDQIAHYRGKFCCGDICNKELEKHADAVLSGMPWFQRNQGKDHVVVASHYIVHHRSQHLTAISKCNKIIIEDNQHVWDQYCPKRLMFPSYYVGTPCPISKEKTHDFAFVGSMKNERPSFQHRRTVCQLTANLSVSLCGGGQQCPALAKSKYGFHIRGDSFGANRLMDTILSGTVPIFTQKEQYDILPDWIDWNQISYFADITNETTFMESINYILSDHEGYSKRHEAVLRNCKLFDWWDGKPFDTYMYMFQTRLWPKTFMDSRYDALLLSQ